MPLPNFQGNKTKYVYQNSFDTVFIYNTGIYDYMSLATFEIDYNETKSLNISLPDMFSMGHNFEDVNMIALQLYDHHGITLRREIFTVKFSSYNQKYDYSTTKVSMIYLKYSIKNHDIYTEESTEGVSFDRWLMEFIRDKKITDILGE